MIISPPFLPARDAQATEAAWLDSAMAPPPSRLTDTHASEGNYPLSHNLSWHNGMHLQAPNDANGSLPVRAIADGTVIFTKEPTTRNDSLDDAQNYNPFDRPGTRTPAWTDNGCVIIEHRTTIGAEGAAETEVVFYSLYMHLSALGRITPSGQTIPRVLRVGDTIWRKDTVGTPGQVYGHAGQLHFEICFDAANMQRLMGRAPNWVPPAIAPATLPIPTADGRTDCLFGSLYFYLPASTPTQTGATRPTNHLSAASSSTLGTALWVKMSHEMGDCSFESFDERGVAIGAARTDPEAEYKLYTEANDRHNALPANVQAQSSPSGWYELLRFGRNIGRGTAATDKDPLPATAAHWRRINTVAGVVWADLNAAGSFKFSDADFPALMGWNCIDDDTSPVDQRCDSDHLKALIRDPDPANTQSMEVAELSKRLGVASVQKLLKRAICKFPSEWDRGTISARYAFVKEMPPFQKNPENWTRLEAHLKAISFDGLPASYLAAQWRMHPKEFIGHFRKCGWLSPKELAQCIPRFAVEQTKASNGQTIYPQSQIGWQTAISRANIFSIHLSSTLRKYGLGQSKLRVAYFLANSIQETIYFSRKSELGGAGTRYAPWYGRGFLQLTWEENYRNYGDFKGWRSQTPDSFRDSLESNDALATDSAGYYWITCAKAGGRAINISREADAAPAITNTTITGVCKNYSYPSRSCIGATSTINYYPSIQAERVARAINTGNANSTGTVNGLIPRNNVLACALNVLVEIPELDVPKQRA
jgi:hypothetical protein